MGCYLNFLNPTRARSHMPPATLIGPEHANGLVGPIRAVNLRRSKQHKIISPESEVTQMKLILGAFLGLLLAATASADSVWTYQGQSQNLFHMNPFLPPAANPCGCALTGTVTLRDAFTPISWDFTAGNLTFTDLNSTLQAYLGPDDPHASGSILGRSNS
jgi:hypothetical protein